MDTNDFRSLFTVLVFAIFMGIVWWAYSARRQDSFKDAANVVFEDDEHLIPKNDESSVSR